MNQNLYEEKLSSFIDLLNQGISPEDIKEDNKDLAELFTTVMRIKHTKKIEEPSPVYVDQFASRLRQESQNIKRYGLFSRMSKISVAACILLVTAVGLGTFTQRVNTVSAKTINVVQTTKITELGGSGLRPAPIPGEQNFSYDQEDKIWEQSPTGTRSLLINPGYAREGNWSPDGKKLVYAGKGDNGSVGIWTAHRDGSQQIRLTNPANSYTFDEHPVWSHDGKRIAFTQTITQNNAAHGFDVSSQEIWVMDADGNNLKRVTEGREPSWSPDGAHLVYTRPSKMDGNQPEIWQIKLNGTEEQKIAEGKEPVWSPSGQFIAFTKTRAENKVLEKQQDGTAKYTLHVSYQEIWALNLINHKETRLTESPFYQDQVLRMLEDVKQRGTTQPAFLASSGLYDDYSPMWSPDGSSLYFARNVNDMNRPHFEMYRLDVKYE